MKKIERFDKYMSFRGLNDNKVTKEINLSVGTLGKSRKIGRDLSDKVVEQILNFYVDLNKIWLLTGEGEMLNPAINTIKNTANSTIVGSNVSGNGNNINNSAANIDKLIEEMAEQRKTYTSHIDELLKQQNKLIDIISKK